MTAISFTKCLVGMAFLAALAQGQDDTLSRPKPKRCRNIPGDPSWPKPHEWDSLNKTVGGRLIQTVPQPSICHSQQYGGTYNAEKCDTLKKAWTLPQTYVNDPAEVMDGYFQNQTCDPFTAKEKPCELGNRASYSIAINGAQDAIAGLKFAREKNVRLVIKNTGHDFLGKSTGKGALSLWTQNLKSIDIITKYNNKDNDWTGAAAKLGAGVIAGDAYTAVAAKGYRMLGGTCPTVGLAGGYTSGGGHGLLSSKYGMGADAVLEWEVVTPEGKLVVATPKKNSDLYWALSGGGAGTWGVVISMTTRIFPDGIVGGAFLSFNSSKVSNETYWGAVEDWFKFLPAYLDQGNTATWQMDSKAFMTNSITVPDRDVKTVEALFKPFLDVLRKRGILYTFQARTSKTYFDHFSEDLGPLPYGPWPSTVQLSTRLIPRAAMQDPQKSGAIVAALESVTEDPFYFMGCHAISVKKAERARNAVFPGWREALAVCLVTSYWDFNIPVPEMIKHKDHLVDTVLPTLEAATPGAGSYLNEMDAMYKGDWKKEFYGANYDELLRVKKKYDPDQLLYGFTSVGSDRTTVDAEGRLCPQGY